MRNYRNKKASSSIEETVSDIIENFSIEDIEAVLNEEDGENIDQLLSIVFEAGDAIGYEILNRLEQYVSNAHSRQASARKLASAPTREIVAELDNRKRNANYRKRIANRRKQASEDMMKNVMSEIADRTKQTGGWVTGSFTEDVEDVILDYMSSPYKAKKFQEALGIPLNEMWRDDAYNMTDWRQVSVREHLLDQRWEDIFDEEYGSRR